MEAGKRLGESLKNGLICLFGDLGAGKTTFIRGLADGIGISSRIQSPTFTYQRVHAGKTKLYHFDFYRLDKPDQMMINELFDAIGKQDGVIAVEWAEKIWDFLPEKRTDIRFKHLEGDCREIIIRQVGSRL
ncbi:tRNA (adenosine(37)-N6)-threonylcarbamoyltransferase complex ATPase subunit type 1 TsaE [Candidatus Peregrinibacteria bacterium]|nr:tRNA (adenosine(37)-N6)-threonylcarbamoyltransferase complex ATPase subunit type 1 TsaE [Candidatus Peregrinibacteria bacterium]